MKILLFYPYVPYPINRGSYQRVFHLAQELGAHHEVDLFCLDSDASATYIPVFEAFCKRIHFEPFQNTPWPKLFPDRLLEPLPATVTHWRNEKVFEALRTFTSGQHYDLVHFCDLVLWPYIKRLNPGCPIVMDRSRVDLMFQKEEFATLPLSAKEKLLRLENIWKLRRLEKDALLHLSATVVCGPDDLTFIRKHLSKTAPIKVLANGANVEFFNSDKCPLAPESDPTLIYCGAMDYSPNIDALLWYFEKIDPLVKARIPTRKLLIVGRDPVERVRALARHEGVTVTGAVEDVRPYYAQSWAQIVPLRIGGGTRLKIVESLAMGIPVVSTSIGAQGLDLEHEKHVLLADSAEDFARESIRILEDQTLRESLALNGKKQVYDRYTWRALGNELSSFYEKISTGSKR